MRIVEARRLPDNPTDAAAAFLQGMVPQVRAAIEAGDLPLCLVFDPADHTHTAWRLAAIQALAREAAPGRVNGVASDDDAAIAAAADYLGRAAGVTGQFLHLDGQGAGNAAKR